MSDGRYIHVRNWERFQHPDTLRAKTDKAGGLPWIRDHTAQLRDEEWLELPFADRGVLQSIRLQYGTTHGRGLVDSTTSLSRLLGQRVLRSQLDRLYHAGFIEFRASKMRAGDLQPARTEAETEAYTDTEPPYPHKVGDVENNSKAKNARAHGTNPRAIAKNDKAQTHLELLAQADQLATSWEGNDSAQFDEALDQLERTFQSYLSFVERDDLWEKAFDHARA